MVMSNRNPMVRYNYEDGDYINPSDLVFGNESYNEVIPTVSLAKATSAGQVNQTPQNVVPVANAAIPYGYGGAQPLTQNAAVEDTPNMGVQAPIQPTIPAAPATGVFGVSLTPPTPQVQEAQPIAPITTPQTIDALVNQILGQGLTSKWSGEGFGSAEKNAADIAKILASIGITDIKQFGKFKKTGVDEPVNPDGQGGFVDQRGNPVDPSLVTANSTETESGGSTIYTAPVGTQEVFGNKVTKQEVPNTYSERQTGNFFGGTFEGKGNTGYGAQFDAQGNPIFYTQGASSNDLANLIKDLGPIGQIALAAATGGMSLPAQLATNAGIQLLAGGNLGDIAKGTALSYLGGQVGNMISGSGGVTDLLGKTGSDIASKTARQFIGSGGKADLGQALLGSAVNTGVNSVIGDIPGLDDLSKTDKNIASSLIAAVATGTPIDQAIQNALVNKASSEARSAVAEARNAEPAAPAPQTYEEMMAGIEPKMSKLATPDIGPSNEEILNQINYDPNLINKAVEDTLGTKNADEPATEKGKAMDDIDWSQIGGDYGGSLADEFANAGNSGNASSIFSGDGGIDLSAFATNAGDEDQAAPPANLAEMLREIHYTETGDPTTNWENFYKRVGGPEVDESNLDNLSPEERARYEAMKAGDTSKYDELVQYLRERPQDFGGADVTQYLEEFNKNFNPAGGYGSQWQTVGTNRVMVNDDGTATILNPTTKETSYLDEDQVKALIKNGTLNSSGSGYVASTGGKGTTPGGSKAATSTKTTTSKPTATNNTGLIMALMAMMAMMNNKGGGGSSAASSIPALSANRSQLPYAPVGRPGAGGVNYFSPTTYTAKAAEGGLMNLAGGGMSNLGGYSDGGRLLKGPGDGVSDSIPATIGGKQPARLATGEFVVPARIVSELGNGSTDAGAKRLYEMMDRVQKKRRKTKNVAADTKAHKYLPS